MKNNILNYLKENVHVIRGLVTECNSWNNSLEEFDYMPNDDEFFDLYFERNAYEAVRASYYGDYNFNDEYVRINVYGNLESKSEYELEEELKENVEYILDTFTELYKDNNVSCYDSYLKEYIEGLEE